MLKFGLIAETKSGYAKVYFSDNNFVTDWIPVLVRKSMHDKESWQLEINEHVACLMSYDSDEGVVLGAIHNNIDTPDPGQDAGKFRILFSDNTLIEYDGKKHKLLLNVHQGEIEIISSSKITIKCPTLDISANVNINGSISADKITSGLIDLSMHKHSVTPGSSITGPPTP